MGIYGILHGKLTILTNGPDILYSIGSYSRVICLPLGDRIGRGRHGAILYHLRLVSLWSHLISHLWLPLHLLRVNWSRLWNDRSGGHVVRGLSCYRDHHLGSGHDTDRLSGRVHGEGYCGHGWGLGTISFILIRKRL